MMQKTFNYLAQKLTRVTANGQYLPLVDGLRFLAIMPVLVQHMSERLIRHTPIEFSTPVTADPLAFLASRGTIGVFLFFAISGFMLALPFARHHLNGAKKPAIKQYFYRRFTRIEPPYLIWMAVFGVVLVAKGSWSAAELGPHWLASSLYIHNLVYGDYSVINPVAWSLEIEIQFYLIAPWLVGLFFSIKHAATRQWVLWASILGFIGLQHAAGWQHFPFKPSLLGQMQHFLVGIWLADRYLTQWQPKPAQRWVYDLFFVPALLIMAYTWTEELAKSWVFAGAMALVFTAAFRGRLFNRLLQNSWVAVVGGMCYTIYLVHLPLMELLIQITKSLTLTKHYIMNLVLQLSLVIPVVLIVSAAAYLLLEKPFMQPQWLKARLLGLAKRWVPVLEASSVARLVKSGVPLLVLASFFPQNLRAQKETNYLLPPADTLVKRAIERSPALRSQDVYIETQRQEFQLEKKSWANLVSVGGTALMGTNNVLDYQQSVTGAEYISVDRRSGAYNAGLTVRFSLGDVINRQDKANIKRLGWERSMVDRTVIEAQVREEVLMRYDRFQASLRMLDLDAQNMEAVRMAYEISKKYFEEGNLPASEYTTVLSRFIAAQKEFEAAKMEAKHLYRMVLEIAGM